MAKMKQQDFTYGYKAKKYYQDTGNCETCTLNKNCADNMGEVMRFLKANGIVCETGKNIQVKIAE